MNLRVEQLGPLYPTSHIQKSGPKHVPYTQPGHSENSKINECLSNLLNIYIMCYRIIINYRQSSGLQLNEKIVQKISVSFFNCLLTFITIGSRPPIITCTVIR